MTSERSLRWLTRPADLPEPLLDELVGCWLRVSNAGGAVGFPFLPVDERTVRAAAVELRASLGGSTRVLVATVAGALAGWLQLGLHASPLTRHWASVSRVQTDLGSRGSGVGAALMREVARAAVDEGLEQLHLAARGGQGLEDFYARLGWEVVGRWPAALRLRPGDDRDEVLMVLHLGR